MCVERQKILADLSKVIVPESLWPSLLPRPCYWISRPDVTKLISLLLASGMAEVVEASAVPLDSRGRYTVAGLFAVPHKAESDRDRRPQNATEARLRWSELPHGSLLGQIRVRPDQHIRGSGDDLSNYVYLLENTELGASLCVRSPLHGC